MSEGIKPIRRVVTANDEKGRSRVLYDSPAPRVKASAFKKGTGMTDIWMYESSPAPLGGDRDDGNLPFHFEPPENGGRLRIVQSDSRPAVYDSARDEFITPEHPPRKTEGGTWERGRQNLYTTRIHKSETLDYGILLTGERILVTDAGEHLLKPGDVCIQIGSWHAWSETSAGSQMAFVMMAGRFDERAPSAAGAAIPPSGTQGEPTTGLRRIVVIDEAGRSKAIADGATPDVRTDPARPGFVSARMWVTDATPVALNGLRESLHVPHALEPPAGGSLCRTATFPPDDTYIRRTGEREVRAFFEAMGSPGASTYSRGAPHPYMQKTRALEFALVIEGEITLVLDTAEVTLRAGDTVVQRGTNHAWSNRSTQPAIVAFSAHDAAW
ncbi:MAG TPA: cupin domain-containing protein [Burkholderiales bacterium]|nr:cupin domain-containing protein [Burkholderiales bacterium]